MTSLVEISGQRHRPTGTLGARVMLMTVRELDNGGSVVPGSTVMIEEPVATPTGLPFPETSPMTTPVPVKTTASPSPTKAGDVLPVAGIIAAGVGWNFPSLEPAEETPVSLPEPCLFPPAFCFSPPASNIGL